MTNHVKVARGEFEAPKGLGAKIAAIETETPDHLKPYNLSNEHFAKLLKVNITKYNDLRKNYIQHCTIVHDKVRLSLLYSDMALSLKGYCIHK